MYAEGDLIDLRHESALYLKDALQALSKVFKIEEGEQQVDGDQSSLSSDQEEEEELKKSDKRTRRIKVPKKKILKKRTQNHEAKQSKSHLDMNLLQYVFADSVKRFYAHKWLSKYYVINLYFKLSQRDTFGKEEEDPEGNLQQLAEEVAIEE